MLMSVDMTTESATPKELFMRPGFSFEPAADGQRFLIDQPVDDVEKIPLTFVSGALRE
jgi:hypothetical protein